jgi:hypothetical protein
MAFPTSGLKVAICTRDIQFFLFPGGRLSFGFDRALETCGRGLILSMRFKTSSRFLGSDSGFGSFSLKSVKTYVKSTQIVGIGPTIP